MKNDVWTRGGESQLDILPSPSQRVEQNNQSAKMHKCGFLCDLKTIKCPQNDRVLYFTGRDLCFLLSTHTSFLKFDTRQTQTLSVHEGPPARHRFWAHKRDPASLNHVAPEIKWKPLEFYFRTKNPKSSDTLRDRRATSCGWSRKPEATIGLLSATHFKRG